MKSTGIVRKLDELGRIVIPIELRKRLGLKEKSPVEIFINGDQIILQKYEPNAEKEDVKFHLQEMLNKTKDPIEHDTLKRALDLIQ